MLVGVLVATFFGCVACSGKDPYNPGPGVGTFHVTATLTSSSCGTTPNPWNFDVRLNHDGSTLYWIQGGAPISALVDANARTQMTSGVVDDVRPADGKTKQAAFSVARSDLLALTLATASAQPATDPALAASFAGTLVYTFAPTDGSDCSDQLAAAGGGWTALPCEVHYDLSGALATSP